MKELKKASTFPKPLPIWRGCKLKVAETDDLSWVLVSRDTRWYGDYAWLVAYGGYGDYAWLVAYGGWNKCAWLVDCAWLVVFFKKRKGGFYEVF